MNMPTYVPGALSYPSPNSPPSNTSFDESSKSSPPAIRSAARAKTTIFKSQGPENFQPPKGAGGSKYKTLKHKISIEEDDDEEDMEMKRLKFLERNRQAALKCRQKKKQWEKELQVRSEEVMKENKTLRIAVQDLKEEALMLKHQLLSHSDCDCTVIRDYLAKATHSNFTLRPVMDLSQKPRC
ncbi:Transcription factor [Umbelopsis nana]